MPGQDSGQEGFIFSEVLDSPSESLESLKDIGPESDIRQLTGLAWFPENRWSANDLEKSLTL